MGIQDNRIPKFGEQAFCPYLLTMAHFNRLIYSTSLLEGRLSHAFMRTNERLKPIHIKLSNMARLRALASGSCRTLAR
jgi:hypothetical protein